MTVWPGLAVMTAAQAWEVSHRTDLSMASDESGFVPVAVSESLTGVRFTAADSSVLDVEVPADRMVAVLVLRRAD